MTFGPTRPLALEAALQRGEGPGVGGLDGGPTKGLLAGIGALLLTATLAGAGFAGAAEESGEHNAHVLRSAANHVDAWRVQEGSPGVPSLNDVFMESPPVDVWERQLELVVPGPSGLDYDLGTLGRDGKVGGSGADADLWLSTLEVRDAT